MAILRINSTIVTKEEAACNCLFGLEDNVTYDSVEDFIRSIPESDGRIDMRINCIGGSVSEGWAIYDALRATGKDISASVEGQCASMATIILLAAKRENRTAKPHATFCIHDPYIPEFTLSGAYRSEDLRRMANDLERESERFLDVYVERTGAEREELRALMREDRWISAEEAERLGFINAIETPLSAKRNFYPLNNKHVMNKERAMKALGDLMVAMGLRKPTAVAMELNTSDGGILTVERENGEPEVGDYASPDGEHVMPDGHIIVVRDGIIVEILEREGGEGEEEGLRREIEEMRERIERLERELDIANAQAKTKDEMEILNAVKMLGGAEKLKQIQGAAKMAGRTAAGSATKGEGDENRFAGMTLREYRELMAAR